MVATMTSYPSERARRTILDGTLHVVKHARGLARPCSMCAQDFVPDRSENWCRSCIDKIVNAPDVHILV